MMTIRLFEEDSYQKTANAQILAHIPLENGRMAIVCDQTIFYATGGGQPGDHGHFQDAQGKQCQILDTRKGQDQAILHIIAGDDWHPAIASSVTMQIDWQRRYAHMRMHSAAHLLCAAIPHPVAGCQIGAEKSRIDFHIEDPQLAKESLGDALNALVQQAHPTRTYHVTDAQMDANPDLVRTMSVQPPRGLGSVRVLEIGDEGDTRIDLQCCGGTHVRNTKEIGMLQVSKIENKGKNIRRIIIRFAEES
ncbi:MAG: alanyl-tRNA editing protein [Pseudomonadota bacterium]